MSVRALLVASVSLLAACGEEASTTAESPIASAPDLAPERQPPAWAEAAPKACDAPTPLMVHHDFVGRVDRLHARLTARGIEGPYLVDTGSLQSFVTYSSDEATSWASTVVSCSTTRLPIIARQRPGQTPTGEPQVGVLGADLVAHGWALDLDLRKGTLRWGPPERTRPEGAIVLPIEWRNGWLVASGIALDGRDVKLVVDTGSTNVIWLDGTPRAGEQREDTVDGTASPIVLFHGEGRIAFAGGEARTVPVDRTDQFPTLQSLATQLGGDVAGILGITALGRDRVILSREALVVVLPATPR